MTLKTKPFDAADYLTSPAMVEGYLNEAMATGDPAVIQQALGAVARASGGMTKMAKQIGKDRVNLYRSLSPAHAATFSTVLHVVTALGLELKIIKPRRARARTQRVGGMTIIKAPRKPRTQRAKLPAVLAGTQKSGRSAHRR
jgi:probable addiction module antidote protein